MEGGSLRPMRRRAPGRHLPLACIHCAWSEARRVPRPKVRLSAACSSGEPAPAVSRSFGGVEAAHSSLTRAVRAGG